MIISFILSSPFMKKYFFPILILSLALFSCGQKDSVKPSAPAVQEEEETHSELISMTGEQIRSIGLQTGVIEEKQLTASLRTTGALRVPNQNKAVISPVYAGSIKTLLVQPGSHVQKGQVVATISNPDFMRTQEDYLTVNARIRLAEQEYQRQQELNQGNAGALKNLQAAEAERQALHTRRLALSQQLRLMGIDPDKLSAGKLVSVLSLRTPISGVVSTVTAKMGSYVDVSTPVAEVVDNSQLHLDLFVYEKDLNKLRNNQRIHFTMTNNPGKEYDAEIYSLGSSFEDETKAVSVHARVIGDKTGLIDGMSITALISLDKIATPAVPSDAIVTYQGQDYVFVVNEPGAKKEATGHGHDHEEATPAGEIVYFKKVPVARGTTEVGYTQITLLQEIPANARIVTKGAFFVLAKLTNSGEDAHGH
jgi:cobalt-zinc-cadmium efflux system membrane fusion protein